MDRKEFEMTEGDLSAMLENIRKDGCLKASDRAWAALGIRMGFDFATVRILHAKGPRFFTAVPVGGVEMVRIPNSELARLIAVAAVVDDKWPESVGSLTDHLSPPMCERLREVGLRLMGLAEGVERKQRLGL